MIGKLTRAVMLPAVCALLFGGCSGAGSGDISGEVEDIKASVNTNINDLANINTPGYKDSDDSEFFQGSLKSSDNLMDVAIIGPGSFGFVDFEKGKRYYSRDGRLKIDSAGRILGSNGDSLAPAVSLHEAFIESSVSISGDGVISYEYFEDGTRQSATAYLEILPLMPDGTQANIEDSTLVQNFVEMSTVDLNRNLLEIKFALHRLRALSGDDDGDIEARLSLVDLLLSRYNGSDQEDRSYRSLLNTALDFLRFN